MIVLIAFVDWKVSANIPLGFLYLFPMLLVGSSAGRIHTAVTAFVCTALTESFDTFEWSAETGIPRDILYFAAFFCMGLFVYEVARSRKMALQHVESIEHEIGARRDAEEQLTVLVESSPAAIFTANAEGTILLANDAAHRLLGVEEGGLSGRLIRDYLPSLVNVPPHDSTGQLFRTAMQCRGRKQSGEVFQADVWFSTYRTSAGTRLAAMVVDTSEDLRSREESSLHQLLTGSRILVGAVSHEIRNVCGAIAVVHENLAKNKGLSQNKDFEALGTLILALEKIAGMDLRQMANQASGVDLASVLEELRIIIESSLEDAGIAVTWFTEPGLPPVWADPHSLMQVFLNLIKNSERSMMNHAKREICIDARRYRERVIVRFRDTGGGVSYPDRLFRPFQPGAQATGLGLYLSRGFMRSFRGDLRYEPEPDGSTFIVELTPESVIKEKGRYGAGNPNPTCGRSQSFPAEPEPASSSRT